MVLEASKIQNTQRSVYVCNVKQACEVTVLMGIRDHLPRAKVTPRWT